MRLARLCVQRCISVVIGMACIIGASVCNAYNDDGHFYTAAIIHHSKTPPFDNTSRSEAVLIGFCAQVPDLAKELDAVTLRAGLIPSLSGSLWGAFSTCWGDDVRYMNEIHHYLHALTDGESKAVTSAALAVLARLRNNLSSHHTDPNAACAVGFAIHLLGDSFAHRRLDADTRTYPPGMGHFRDNHNPDYIGYRPDREALWESYVKALGAAMQISVESARWDELFGNVKKGLTGGTPDNRFNTNEFREAFKAALQDSAESKQSIWASYDPPVEELYSNAGWWGSHVLQYSFQDVVDRYVPDAANQLQLDRVLKIYLDAARFEFNNRKIPAKCDPSQEGR